MNTSYLPRALVTAAPVLVRIAGHGDIGMRWPVWLYVDVYPSLIPEVTARAR